MSEENTDIHFKGVLLGSVGVGKSNILLRLSDDIFDENLPGTVGVDFRFFYHTTQDGKRVCIQFWDTAGQEKMESIAKLFYKDCYGAIIVYDVTNEASFKRIDFWIEELQKYAPDSKIIVLANKTDLAEERKIPTEEGQAYCKAKGYFFAEVSAKENPGQGIEKAVSQLAEDIAKNVHVPAQEASVMRIDEKKLENAPTEKKGCC